MVLHLKRLWAAGMAVVCLACAAIQFAWAGSPRVVKTRVEPKYPYIARKMNIKGTVRVSVTVLPSGTVKSAKPLGGNPVLIDSAMEAVTKWRFEPAAEETVETVSFQFGTD